MNCKKGYVIDCGLEEDARDEQREYCVKGEAALCRYSDWQNRLTRTKNYRSRRQSRCPPTRDAGSEYLVDCDYVNGAVK